MSFDPRWGAARLAREIQKQTVSATQVVETVLQRIDSHNNAGNAFSELLRHRAKARAQQVDAMVRRGEDPGPLAGVPFGVKNLFDVQGVPTLAGSTIASTSAPATRDAPVVQRLEAAGAILVATLNMSEYAYDYTGETVHSGPIRNPHDRERMAGGSSGGSASAVGAGLLPIALGSDTNGSIRVPASYCGVFGLKPTFGRLSRVGAFPFVASLDHVGSLARSAEDLALAYDAMQGVDEEDASCVNRPAEPTAHALTGGVGPLRIAFATGAFENNMFPEARLAMARVVEALSVTRSVALKETERARAASLVITASEGATLHMQRLKDHAAQMVSVTRDRLMAGAMLPTPLVEQAHRFRRWYRDEVLAQFRDIDVLITPATPFSAPLIGATLGDRDGVPTEIRRMMGEYTIPFSFIGFPAAVVPIPLSPMPIGIQIVARPWRELDVLRVAHALEAAGVAGVLPLA